MDDPLVQGELLSSFCKTELCSLLSEAVQISFLIIQI